MHNFGRKPSVLHPNRLSLALTSRLSSFLDKADTDTPSPTSPHQSPLDKLARPLQPGFNPLDLQNDFHSNIPAEPPTEPCLLLQNTYPSLRALRTDADLGDGLWLCSHCRHENILRHYKGGFPFKHLRCDRCTHILCPACHTTAILSPIPFGLIHARPSTPGREIRYCHVCPACGLTHRAEQEGTTLDFYGTTCADCGLSSWGDWPRFHIGDVEPYRRDPDACFVELVERRAEDAVRIAFRWVVANGDAVSTSEQIRENGLNEECTDVGVKVVVDTDSEDGDEIDESGKSEETKETEPRQQQLWSPC